MSVVEVKGNLDSEALYLKLERNVDELRKREFHLAELIDEVVYADEQREKSLRRAEAEHALLTELEAVLHNLLGYVIALEGDVLLPAFLDLSNMVPQDPLANRSEVSTTLGALSEGNLSARTKKLIATLKAGPSGARVEATRERLIRSAAQETVSVEDSLILCGAFLQKKEELRALMEDIRNRLTHLATSSPTAYGRSTTPGVDSLKVSGQASNLEGLHQLREQVEALTSERDHLLRTQWQPADKENERRVRELTAENEALHEKVQQLRNRIAKEQARTKEITNKLEVATESCERLEAEANQLQREVSLVKREQSRVREQIDDMRVAESTLQLRQELERVILESTETQAALESRNAKLEAALTVSEAQCKEHSKVAHRAEGMAAELQRENGSLKKELFSIQQSLLSSSPKPQSNLEGKVRALEATISHLTSQLANVETTVVDVENQYREERAVIVSSFDEERQRYQNERRECDELVERMANELEQLSIENRTLRAAAATRQL